MNNLSGHYKCIMKDMMGQNYRITGTNELRWFRRLFGSEDGISLQFIRPIKNIQ